MDNEDNKMLNKSIMLYLIITTEVNENNSNSFVTNTKNLKLVVY